MRQNEDGGCRIDNALTLDRSMTPYSATLSMSCRAAATLYMWERHVVRPAAERFLGAEVERIETFGAYSCRRVNGARTGRWSNHSTGDAIDISGFRLADGRRITVKADFYATGPEGDFLRDIRDGACGLFSATLSPDYNALHADHFHLDMGAYTICS
ncbi:MAG: extensin family protein [Alphaproteobacteria bacterium]|nr:extensin family protein [Alphaproteobacteria bacterium]